MSALRITHRSILALALCMSMILTSCVQDTLRAPVEPDPSNSPSGRVAPREDLPGWRFVFGDDFADDLSADWGRYNGAPGGDPYSRWSPENVVVSNGVLTLTSTETASGTITGGVSNWPRAQQYGRWEVRFRADPSDDVTFHFLLWPANEVWPPEIDFAESFGGGRQYIDSFIHWVDGSGQQQKNQQNVPGDFTEWNTVGVEWTPDEIRYLIDGQVWGIETGERVPHTPMWLGLQAQSGGCQKVEAPLPPCPWVGTPDTTNIDIDWIAVYEQK
ncbi:MAG: glycoside hydrolase family 16 protein [Rhodococcus sp. (in: high G+C Gram-positive bacteria)]